MNFKEYLQDFEAQVVVAGVEKEVFKKRDAIPVRRGKLDETEYGRMLGKVVASEVPLAIDYYGRLKKSTGFFRIVESVRKNLRGKQVSRIEVSIVHFAAIRIEQVAMLAPKLVAEFPTFKRLLLDGRGFQHNFLNGGIE